MMDMTKVDLEATSQVGIVRWFNVDQGYGFVTVAEDSEDILLHINLLRAFGTNTVLAGSAIEFECEKTERGMRISKVLSLAHFSRHESQLKPNVRGQVHSELEPVKVKWYNSNAGYGFVNRFQDQDDIFLGAHVLKQFGRTQLSPDEALSARIQVIEGKEKVYELGLW